MTGIIRGVLLDVDDTLVDTRSAFRHALLRVADEYLQEGLDPDVVVQFWRADKSGWYRAHTRGEMSHREQRMRRANELHAEFGGPTLDDGAYDIWDAGFERHFQEGWRPFADALPLLEALELANIPYGAVTNADSAYQRLKLDACELERVEVFVGVDTFGFGKPDARVFVEGARRLGLDPRDVAYVGDEPDVDAVGAVRAGLTGIWLDRPGTRRGNEPEGAMSGERLHHIQSLVELPHLLGL